MKKSIVKTAKTTKEAIRLALEEIGKREDEVEVEVLEEESSGFLGFIGSRDAVVRVSYQEDIKDALENLGKEIENTQFYVDEDKQEVRVEDPIEVEDIEEDKEETIIEEDLSSDEAPVRKEKSEGFDRQRSNIDKYYEAKDFLEAILKAMHFEDVSVIGNLEDNIIKLEAKIDENDTGIAIGKGGSTLEAIELLVVKAIDSRRHNLRVNIDINNYKRRRDEKIVELARDTAIKVQRSKKPWNLRYMNSYERRLAHEEVSKHKNVTSHSEGSEPKRYVVVDYVE
ncbi:RNA-binding cell elongation regulator Jag/EloR [Anaerococcus sp. AGMB09787]|uniref:RNA-binding cell elongation regulator Jag/EloR n=1 Tax=Anaerococcus sp. AGMB09787 TaxID=2922869 RepID=UPI001FAED3F7|nr:RNA-binding cell elongation regulator Jag/EloR [Anaerococcus sp. AGMB09787]